MTEQLTTPTPESSSRKLGLEMTAAALARLLLNTSRRFAYPFAPALARGLGVPLVSITSLIALNQLTGVLSPLFGPVIDRWGYRTMMLLGLGLMSIGLSRCGSSKRSHARGNRKPERPENCLFTDSRNWCNHGAAHSRKNRVYQRYRSGSTVYP